jgi:hypothetical protein
MTSKRFVGKAVELASLGVTFDRRVELRRIEHLIPSTKLGKFSGRKPLNGLFDFFRGGHR